MKIANPEKRRNDDREEDPRPELLRVLDENPASAAQQHPHLPEERRRVRHDQPVVVVAVSLPVWRLDGAVVRRRRVLEGRRGGRGQLDGAVQPALLDERHHEVVRRVVVGGGGEPRVGERRLGLRDGPVVDDGARVEEDEAVEEGEDLPGGLVDGADDGAAGLLDQAAQDLHHLLRRVRVQPRGRLVEEQQPRVGEEAHGDGHALALPAADAARALLADDGVGALGDVQHAQHAVHVLQPRRVRLQVRQLQLGLVHQEGARRQRLEERVVLRDVVEDVPHRGGVLGAAVDAHLAGGGLDPAAEQVEQRRLAGAGGAHQGDQLAGADGDVGVADDLHGLGARPAEHAVEGGGVGGEAGHFVADVDGVQVDAALLRGRGAARHGRGVIRIDLNQMR